MTELEKKALEETLQNLIEISTVKSTQFIITVLSSIKEMTDEERKRIKESFIDINSKEIHKPITEAKGWIIALLNKQ